jgi:hypothetical protein
MTVAKWEYAELMKFSPLGPLFRIGILRVVLFV